MSKILFLAHVTEGYSLRNTICMLKNESDEITMVLDRDTITIKFQNKGQYAIHEVTIHGKKLENFKYNIESASYPITVNTTELVNATKSVGRKDGLKIYWLEGQSKIIIEPIKSSKDAGSTAMTFVNIINKEYNGSDFFNNQSADLNIKIQARVFSELCSQANTSKCNYLEIGTTQKEVHFVGIMPDGTTGLESNHPYPNSAPDASTDTVIKIRVPMATIKTLSKLYNISPSGALLKLSFAANNPIRIKSKIGYYGTYKIYLRNYKVN